MNHLKQWICALFTLTLVCAALTGCAPQTQPPQATNAAPKANDVSPVQERVSGVGFYFDTVVTLTLFDASQETLDRMLAMCARYEGLLSKTIETSDVFRINHAGGQSVQVDPETWEIIRRAKEISAATGGAFSITIAPLSAMWDFTGGTERMPGDEERLAALPLVDDSAIVLGDDWTVTLPAGMEIDLGGIAKGYIADMAAKMARETASGGTLNFGGNVYVVGKKPDGSLFRVGIQDPDSATGSPLLVISLEENSVVTSGIYERFFIRDGVRYHHILDPKTGLSAQTDLASATIVNASSMTADAVATACVVLGSGEALELLTGLELDAVLLLRDGTVLATPGFAEKYAMVSVK